MDGTLEGLYGVGGITELPAPGWTQYWDRLVLPAALKQQALHFCVFSLRHRGRFATVSLPMQGILLLQGPPGTGKTTLARGLANRTAETLGEAEGESPSIAFCEIKIHSLGSGVLGESPKQVKRVFERSLVDLSQSFDHVVVLLDEVESLAISRQKASMDTNPIDLHRATNALLESMDEIGRRRHNLVFVATSNYPEAIDDAFRSRVDLMLDVGMPTPDAVREILADTFVELTGRRSEVPPELIAELSADGRGRLDARQLRKLVLESVLLDLDTVLDPARLEWPTVMHYVRSQAAHGP